MATTKEELESFHRFAVERLKGAVDCDLDDLVNAWHETRERDSVNAILRQSLADIESGLGRPARDVSEELRLKYDLPAR